MKRVDLSHILNNVAGAAQATTARLVSGSIRMVMEANREELLQFIKTADTDRARALLLDVCKRYPQVAGIVTLLMNGSPEEAISNIAMFDQEMAKELRAQRKNLELVQEAWRKGAEGYEA